MTGWLLYLLTCTIWAVFAMRMQHKHHADAAEWQNWMCAVLNFVFCPICILIAACLPKWWKSDKNAEATKADSE